MNLALVSRMAWRDVRSGEMGLLLVALLVAVGTVTSISLFVDRLQGALVQESASFLAADRQISSSREIPPSFIAKAQEKGLQTAQALVFQSMIYGGEYNQLVSVKAVDGGYPLRGELIVADQPFGEGYAVNNIPQPGEIWLDSRLFPALGVGLGDLVEVGMAELRIGGVLVAEPDRGGSMFDLGPRLLMNLQNVPETGVVQPGSRLSYRMLLAGPEDELQLLKEDLPLEPNYRWLDIRGSNASIGNALDRAESFLLLGGLLGVLLAGVAVGLSAHRYAQRHFDHVGVLKTLGATPGQILRGFMGLLLLVGAAAIGLGLAAGGLLHIAIVELLAQFLPVSLPAPGLRPFTLGAVTGLICALAFAMPAFVHLKSVEPMRVIRRDLGVAPLSRWASYGAAAAGSLALLVWYTKNFMLTFWALIGAVVVITVFGFVAYALLRGGRVAGMQAKSGWRLALSALQRRRQESTAQILIFGLAIMLLLVLVLIRTALIEEWRAQVPDDSANHFVMNIGPEEVEGVRALIEQSATQGEFLYPVVRGRIVGVNGLDAKGWRTQNPHVQRRISSERNLTWMASQPSNNVVIEGQWWDPDSTVAEISLEEEYADEMGLSLGDKLDFDIGGQQVSAVVSSLRSLEWESLSPNFYIIFSPQALADFPATYMTSFYLERQDKTFLNTLLSTYPTITVIEIDAVIEQVQTIVDQVTQAVELVLVLVLFSGCLVLIASIQSSRDARMSELALVRALGGTRRLIAGSLTGEFLILGVFAGLVAVLGAELTVAALQTQIFELSAQIHPWIWLLGPLSGALIITVVGLIGSRSLLDSPPMHVLRGLN
ncbi:MAG: FtsX-like permease family protein [Pseudomonadota bacterium]|nr:FtsX-like permease family protein [Pseudomonadota bacterium]